jgi:two-component system chemotaxis sensor kinase CheA
MTIDISQFHAVFFEESFEGLDVMEDGLLNLDLGAVDDESINTIFRAAHSIKGGAGTFGFSAIAGFTHTLETLLDEMRSGKRTVTQAAVDVLLQAVDVLREMLAAVRDGGTHDLDRATAVEAGIKTLLNGGEVAPEPRGSRPAPSSSEDPTVQGWKIRFQPKPHLFQTGNDPVRLFRELAGLGELSTRVDATRLPPFEEIEPEQSYLAWELELKGDVKEQQIREIFEWVEGDCLLEISPMAGSAGKGVMNHAPTFPDTPSEEPQVAAISASGVDAERRSGERRKAAGNGESSSIRVGIDKIDALINIVGELVITQSMLNRFGEHFDPSEMEALRDGLAQLSRATREIQEAVLSIRMLPISVSFNRFPRLVRDLSGKLGKKVELKLLGEQTELDKTVLEKIGDPLVHLVRNSLDHGIEMPEKRIAAGKPETGVLHLNAFHEGGNIVIEISDDGAGLNKARILQRARERGLVREGEDLTAEQIHELIFQPGFSTAEVVSDVSGRGVGMDVVRRNIKDLSGVVEVRSEEGKGSTFTIRLPLTLAILDGQLVRVGGQVYVVPLVNIIESIQIDPRNLCPVAGKREIYKLRDEYLPILNTPQIFNIDGGCSRLDKGILVIVEGDGQKAGLFVDELLGQQQVVIKSLESNYQRVDGISGATILGDGAVALILDVSGLVALSRQRPDGFKRTWLELVHSEAA